MRREIFQRTTRNVGVVAALVLAVASNATPTSGAPRPAGSWPYSNANLANTRVASGSLINSADVKTLRQVWSFTLTGAAAKPVDHLGTFAANPIVVNGTVYLQDLRCNVYALSLATGRLLWEYRVNRPEKSGPGPNGVAVVGGTVYGTSPRAVFALRAATGERIWVSSHLLTRGEGTFGIQPQVASGRVYLATQYGSGPGGGVLMALRATNGAKLWTFNTVAHRDPGVKAVGLGSGGAWETPLVSANGTVTFGTGNPYQSAASAIADPSAQLYTDSEVTVNGATGRLLWYYQGVANDFLDHDMQASPIAARVGPTNVIVGGGKMGYVYEMNAATGHLIWKTPVGRHNGHDNDSLKALHHHLKLKTPVTIWPGSLGGILTDMALADNTVYVTTVDLATTITTLTAPLGNITGRPSGEVEALNLATGRVEWDTKVKGIPVGAATVSNNLVLTTLFQGTLVALNRTSGAVVYQKRLANSTNSPIAVAGATIIVPAGGPKALGQNGVSQIDAYAVTPVKG